MVSDKLSNLIFNGFEFRNRLDRYGYMLSSNTSANLQLDNWI